MEHDDGGSIVATGPAVIFYPAAYNHCLVVPPGEHAELVCANVMFKEALRNPFVLALPAYVVIPLAELDGIGESISLLFSEAYRKSFGHRFIMDRLCDILVFQLIRHAISSGHLIAGVLAGFSDPGIARALTSIHGNLTREWQVETLAQQASMSRSKFAKKFQELVGQSPAAYVTDWRLSHAENLLLQLQPVKTVATAVGYHTQQSFTRAFINRNGLAPTQWLTQQKKKAAG